MEIKIRTNTYLSLKDKYGQIRNEQILIIGKSGYGKGLAGGGIAEEFYKAGYLILVIADPKRELEYCYQMFEPKARYHLEHLRTIGKKPTKKNVKIYHPFTFDIPTSMLPPINFYTLSLKNLGRKEWSLLAETGGDTEAMRLLLQASRNISNEDGLYGITHYIQNAIRGKIAGKRRKADPKNFYLDASSGTMKSMTDISNYLQPFKRHYFLAKDSCPLNLNWKKVLQDQKNYHVFVSNLIDDEKIRDFVVLSLLSGIIENKRYLKKPVLVIIPEIRDLCPFKPQGHKLFLAEAVKKSLSLMRASGRGMSSLLDSQVFIDIDESVRNSATLTLFGELGGGGDMEKVAKAFNYKREIRNQLKKMEFPNSYLIVGKEDLNGFTIFFPSSCHAEPSYNFYEMFRQEKREETKLYTDTLSLMKNILKDEEDKIKDKIKRQEKQYKEEEEKKRKERDDAQKIKDKEEEKDTKIQKVETKNKEKLMKLCYEMKIDENVDLKLRTFRQIGKKIGLNHVTVKKYFQEYEDKLNQEDSTPL